MLTELLTAAQAAQDFVLAAPVDPSTAPTEPVGPKVSIDTSGIIKFFAAVIAPIILAFLGVVFLTRAKGGQVSSTVTSSGIALVGIAFIVGAMALMGFGGSLVDLIFREAMVMKLRTDDDIYRARLLYLGPPGYTLPFQLPYAQYGLFAILASVFTFVGWLVTGTLLSVGFTLAAAIFLTAYIWHHVDPDRPAKKVIQVALTDWQSIKPPAAQLPRITTSHIRWRDTITEPDRPEITDQKTEVQR